jgi:hypothetical protein
MLTLLCGAPFAHKIVPLHWPMGDRDITINRNVSFSFKNGVVPWLSREFDGPILCASIRMANLMVEVDFL